MSKNWEYISGNWNCTCDVCSLKIKASESKLRWDGFITCSNCWEPRHSLDFVKSRVDKIVVPFIRDIPPLVFTDVHYVDTGNNCTPASHSGICAWAQAGCSIAGNLRV